MFFIRLAFLILLGSLSQAGDNVVPERATVILFLAQNDSPGHFEERDFAHLNMKLVGRLQACASKVNVFRNLQNILHHHSQCEKHLENSFSSLVNWTHNNGIPTAVISLANSKNAFSDVKTISLANQKKSYDDVGPGDLPPSPKVEKNNHDNLNEVHHMAPHPHDHSFSGHFKNSKPHLKQQNQTDNSNPLPMDCPESDAKLPKDRGNSSKQPSQPPNFAVKSNAQLQSLYALSQHRKNPTRKPVLKKIYIVRPVVEQGKSKPSSLYQNLYENQPGRNDPTYQNDVPEGLMTDRNPPGPLTAIPVILEILKIKDKWNAPEFPKDANKDGVKPGYPPPPPKYRHAFGRFANVRRKKRTFVVEPEHSEIFEMDFVAPLPQEALEEPEIREPLWDFLGILSALRGSFFGNLWGNYDTRMQRQEEETGLDFDSIGTIKIPSLLELVSTTLPKLRKSNQSGPGFLIVIFGGTITDLKRPTSDLTRSIKYMEGTTRSDNALLVVTAGCPSSRDRPVYPIPLLVKGPQSSRFWINDLCEVPLRIREAFEASKHKGCKHHKSD